MLELKKIANYNVFYCGHSSVVERRCQREGRGSTPLPAPYFLYDYLDSILPSGNTYLRSF